MDTLLGVSIAEFPFMAVPAATTMAVAQATTTSICSHTGTRRAAMDRILRIFAPLLRMGR